jgi:hypothetical protein
MGNPKNFAKPLPGVEVSDVESENGFENTPRRHSITEIDTKQRLRQGYLPKSSQCKNLQFVDQLFKFQGQQYLIILFL